MTDKVIMPMSRSQERRIAVQKGTVSPERLAEILLDYDLQLRKLMHSASTFDDFKKAKIGLATDLLKALDIREKE